MIYAIIHRMSGNILEKHEASSDKECTEQYLKCHPELECDTVSELMTNYPTLVMNLVMVRLH